jgi:hypothetical protein
MNRIIPTILLCAALSGCSTLNSIQSSDMADTAGSFQLTPTAPNTYWNNGKSFDYNQYEIKITANPVPAKIRWNGKIIGSTPFVYKFTGVLDYDDKVVVTAESYDEAYGSQGGTLKGRRELPREMRFDLIKKDAK